MHSKVGTNREARYIQSEQGDSRNGERNRYTALMGVCFLILTGLADSTTGQAIVTVAGNGNRSIVGQPFGIKIGPDCALYIWEIQNRRVLRLDYSASELMAVTGNGMRGFSGDGGPPRHRSSTSLTNSALTAMATCFSSK